MRVSDDLSDVNKSVSAVTLSVADVRLFVDELFSFLFPIGRKRRLQESEIKVLLGALIQSVQTKIPSSKSNKEALDFFWDNLQALHQALMLDAEAQFEQDPAATSVEEVILCYPGFVAIAFYRIAHLLYLKGLPLVPRIISYYAHERTGIDIHPGATVGKGFSIDHGTGVVIGQTTTIGDRVQIYQGVTLGALSVSKEQASKKRHPTVQDRVIIYANATVLGGDTIIGHDSVIGGNAWVVSSIPPNTTVAVGKNKVF